MKTWYLLTQPVQTLLMLSLLVLQTCYLPAQVNIQFVPALNGETVNGLFTALVQNTGTVMYNGKIKITVRERNNTTVLIAITPAVSIRPGVNILQSLATQASIQFGNSSSAGLIARTGRFPENDYEYCFEFTGTENKPAADQQVFENCFNYSVQPPLPLNLLYPADGDELCDTRPGFTWQPAMPLISSYRYRIMLAVVKDKQDAVDALLNNVPVFQENNLAGFMLRYPTQAPDLQKDKKYVWQVTVYENNRKITQSEIWSFNISCNEKKPDTVHESYRQLSGSLNGNYYMAAGLLHFSIVNPYSPANLQYSITDLADPEKIIGNLPPVKVQTGLNKIDMTLEDISGMQVNKMYLLKIKNIGAHILYLQFIYKGDEAQ